MYPEPLYQEGTKDLPSIRLDAKKGLFHFGGRVFPENAFTFWQPIYDWIRAYSEDRNEITPVIFKMTYFNTASAKGLLDLMFLFEDIANDDGKVTIDWHYADDDEEIQEAGLEYSEIVEIPFTHTQYKGESEFTFNFDEEKK